MKLLILSVFITLLTATFCYVADRHGLSAKNEEPEVSIRLHSGPLNDRIKSGSDTNMPDHSDAFMFYIQPLVGGKTLNYWTF